MYIWIFILNKSIIYLILRVKICAPGEEREEQRRMGQTSLSHKKVKVRPGWGWGWDGDWGMPITTFSTPTHLHLESWVGGGWLIKIWRSVTLWTCAVCMCLCAYAWVCTCAWVYVSVHAHCTHKYLGASYKRSQLIPEKSWPSRCYCELGLFWESFQWYMW